MALSGAGDLGLAARLFGATPARRLALLRAAWPHAVGAELARRTEVVTLEAGVLRVRVPDAGWRRVLHRMQPQVLARLRDLTGALAPAKLGFTEGHVSGTPSDPTAAPAPPAAGVPSALAESAALIADDEIRGRFLAAAARYLERMRARPGGQD